MKCVLYLNIYIQKEGEKSENEKDKRSGENLQINTSALIINEEQSESVIRQREREITCMIVVCTFDIVDDDSNLTIIHLKKKLIFVMFAHTAKLCLFQ